ncbi:DUF58 domain-containing protein [uncultured Acinetobacter sp.]|uniref:DUF58 domain-containing protein n=1 Tax=uncultured Acinetobacter sp. TaxID=165433 RepID=UPI00260D9C3A|nr:DUF58 domain-containing protein [uncultured Acinetobacter sp.]
MRQRWQSWLEQRFLWQGQKCLQHKDILVFLHRSGYLYVLLILITFIAGVNYANNLILGFCFLLSAVLAISFYLAYLQLKDLNVQIDCAQVSQVGHSIQLTVSLSRLKPCSRYVLIECNAQRHYIYVQDARQQLSINFDAQTRGAFYYPRLRISSGYPLGLVRAWSDFYFKDHLVTWVAPSPAPFEQEQRHAIQHAGFDEFYELKTYQIGDRLSQVAWKQLARGQGMQIKNFAPHAQQQHVEIDYMHMPAVGHEQKLSLMMGLVEQCEQQQLAYTLQLPHNQLSLGQGTSQLQRAKRILAEA